MSGFPFGGLERRCWQSRLGYLGVGRAEGDPCPSTSVQLSQGFLPPTQLPILFNLSDSLKCLSREGILQKRGSQRLVLLAGLAASAEKRCF